MPLRQLADVAAILAELEVDPGMRGAGKDLLTMCRLRRLSDASWPE
jgi:hypothetical protein